MVLHGKSHVGRCWISTSLFRVIFTSLIRSTISPSPCLMFMLMFMLISCLPLTWCWCWCWCSCSSQYSLLWFFPPSHFPLAWCLCFISCLLLILCSCSCSCSSNDGNYMAYLLGNINHLYWIVCKWLIRPLMDSDYVNGCSTIDVLAVKWDI